MDPNAILSKLNRIAAGASPGAFNEVVFEKGRIPGPDPVALAQVDLKILRKLLQGLRADADAAVDHLENITIVQVDNALMATYFFRSSFHQASFAVRATTVPASPDAWASLPSVRDLWKMAAPLENYVSELFGIRFVSQDGADIVLPNTLLTERLVASMRSFPLRKNFWRPS